MIQQASFRNEKNEHLNLNAISTISDHKWAGKDAR